MLKSTIQRDGYYHHLVDGSAHTHTKYDTPIMGACVVGLTNDPSKPGVLPIKVTPNEAFEIANTGHRSKVAETLAALVAVELAPTNAGLKLYTDETSVFQILINATVDNIPFEANAYSSGTLLALQKKLYKAANQRDCLLPVLSNKHSWVKKDPYGKVYLRNAHNGAAFASGAKTRKEIYDPSVTEGEKKETPVPWPPKVGGDGWDPNPE